MCPTCQAPVRGDADFCTNCGTRVRQPATPGSAETTRPAAGQPFPPASPPPASPPPASPPPASPPPAFPPPAFPPPASQPPAFPPPAFPPPGAQPRGVAPRAATAPYHFDVRRLALLDRTVAIATALVVISTFLPWFGVLGYSISGISLHAYLAIALLVGLALLGYLALRAGWEAMPVRLPIAHAPLLLVGTSVQLLLVLIGFLQSDGLGHEFGAYLGLLAALVACGAIAIPVIRAIQAGQQAGSN